MTKGVTVVNTQQGLADVYSDCRVYVYEPLKESEPDFNREEHAIIIKRSDFDKVNWEKLNKNERDIASGYEIAILKLQILKHKKQITGERMIFTFLFSVLIPFILR